MLLEVRMFDWLVLLEIFNRIIVGHVGVIQGLKQEMVKHVIEINYKRKTIKEYINGKAENQLIRRKIQLPNIISGIHTIQE